MDKIGTEVELRKLKPGDSKAQTAFRIKCKHCKRVIEGCSLACLFG